jgi:hypothetical protein
MIFDKLHLLFRIRIHNLKLRIRIRQKVSDPYGSGSCKKFGSLRIRILQKFRLLTDPDPAKFRLLTEPDPAKSFGSLRIRILQKVSAPDPQHWPLEDAALQVAAPEHARRARQPKTEQQQAGQPEVVAGDAGVLVVGVVER